MDDIEELAWEYLEAKLVDENTSLEEFLRKVDKERHIDLVAKKVDEIQNGERGRYLKAYTGINERRVKEYYLHRQDGVWLVKVGRERRFEIVLRGDLTVEAEIIESTEKRPRATYTCYIDGIKLTGEIEEILEDMRAYGKVVGAAEDARKVVSLIFSSTEKKVHAHSAVGLFQVGGSIHAAIDEAEVFPMNDSQAQFLKDFANSLKMASASGYAPREVIQASADFIAAMPKENVFQALIARGFCTIAPLAFELKKSQISVFPYLYLHGEKGSSKTHIANISATKTFGERQMLNSESIDSPFRLAMEFSATTFPRAIDEAQDVFTKNFVIFKAAATSLLATKRGTRERHMVDYPALCSFVFTSNIPPIQPEEDAQNAIAERVIKLECQRGDEFNREKYLEAMNILSNAGVLLGLRVVQKLKERKMDWYIDEVIRIAQHIQENVSDDYRPTVRRCYSLAEMVLGTKIYYEILDEEKILPPYPFRDESHMVLALCRAVVERERDEEMRFIENFLNWAEAIQHRPDAEVNGVFTACDGDLIITANALKAFRRFYNLKSVGIGDVEQLAKEIGKLGDVEARYGVHADTNKKSRRGVRVKPRLEHENGA